MSHLRTTELLRCVGPLGTAAKDRKRKMVERLWEERPFHNGLDEKYCPHLNRNNYPFISCEITC